MRRRPWGAWSGDRGREVCCPTFEESSWSGHGAMPTFGNKKKSWLAFIGFHSILCGTGFTLTVSACPTSPVVDQTITWTWRLTNNGDYPLQEWVPLPGDRTTGWTLAAMHGGMEWDDGGDEVCPPPGRHSPRTVNTSLPMGQGLGLVFTHAPLTLLFLVFGPM